MSPIDKYIAHKVKIGQFAVNLNYSYISGETLKNVANSSRTQGLKGLTVYYFCLTVSLFI